MIPNETNVCITMTLFKRLEYTEKSIAAIIDSLSYSGISLSIIFSIDYFDDSIPNYIKSINNKFKSITEIHNRPILGCNMNTLQAITMGLSQYEYVIHIEDDVVVCKDFFKFMFNNLSEIDKNEKIISISGYNRNTEQPNSDNINQTLVKNNFTCWGIGFSRSKSKIFLDNWIPTSDYTTNGTLSLSWDSHIQNNIFAQNCELLQLVPSISRCQNIGALNGTWVQDPIFHRDSQVCPVLSDHFINKSS